MTTEEQALKNTNNHTTGVGDLYKVWLFDNSDFVMLELNGMDAGVGDTLRVD